MIRFVGMLCWLAMFMLCNLGYWELFRRKTGVHEAYYPSLTVAVQVTVLFAAGCLNFLREASWALWALGFAVLLYRACKDRSLGFLGFYRKPVFLFVLLFTGAFFAYCYGCMLTEYDNFTHWGLVLKQMVTEKHFPDYRDPVIMFKTYPLGTAIYMFFGLSIPKMGMQEDIAMFLQAYMMLCFTAALFSRAEKHPALTTAFMSLAMIFFVSTSLGMRDLRVDVVLALAAGCALLYVWDYCIRPVNWVDFYLGSAYLVALSQIKNSAMLMGAICSVAVLLEGRRDRRYRSRALLAASPVAAWFLWKKRYSNVYSGADISLHAMTLRNYLGTFRNNPVSKIGMICLDLLRYALTFRKAVLCGLCFLLVAVLVLRVWKGNGKRFRWAAGFSFAFYGCYELFLLGMYIFSMGAEEAAGLPSVARYTNTALFIMNYMLCSVCLRLISQAQMKDKRQRLCVAALLLMYPVRMIACGETPFFVQLNARQELQRVEMNRLIAEYNVPKGSGCCLLVPESDNGRTWFCLRYALMSGDVRALHATDAQSLEEIPEPYVFVYDEENPEVESWLKTAAQTNPDAAILIPR